MSLFPGRSKIYGGKTEGAQSLQNNQNELLYAFHTKNKKHN